LAQHSQAADGILRRTVFLEAELSSFLNQKCAVLQGIAITSAPHFSSDLSDFFKLIKGDEQSF
jgi:hypothetical protein